MLASGHKLPWCNLWMVTEPLCSGLKDPIGRPEKKRECVKEKTMVLLDVPNYAGVWPQVAEVQLVDGDRALVQWFKGSKNNILAALQSALCHRWKMGALERISGHKHNMIFRLQTNTKWEITSVH